MRPQDPLDWTVFVFLLIGAFAWGYYVATGINLIDEIFDPISTSLADIVYVLILLSGVYWIVRVSWLRSPPRLRMPRRSRRR